ncbi:energy-coupling factor transporter transmembrane protein EcfT [Lacrimispora sp. NSJ-141]|uniref:Energy-coupling factor transporter transmembrane protein EcfT n=1 Tax=Lientehia hominis TaxID=2897778 RepID=A0AAP2RG73_9FIRM|nr:energy-coupling factor transporter transmembrane component T [Lientehia hominis]MCD2491346.1 energy-coupling factor transporter transmembrane protein EcfT [Lientehia hominis]
MSSKKVRSGLWIDPRTKIVLLLLCVLTAAMAPSLFYEILLVCLVSVFGLSCGKIRYALIGMIVYMIFYFLTLATMQLHGSVQVMLVAFFGLVHKVYPCGFLSGIILTTTKTGEFLSAMNRSHISKKIVVPIAVMLRHMPTIREDWRFIKDAMKMRDVSPSLKNFLKYPGMTIECIYVPLMMAASKTADELTIASVTRGIENPKPRTSFIQVRFGISDLIVFLCFLAMFLAGQFCKGVFL